LLVLCSCFVRSHFYALRSKLCAEKFGRMKFSSEINQHLLAATRMIFIKRSCFTWSEGNGMAGELRGLKEQLVIGESAGEEGLLFVEKLHRVVTRGDLAGLRILTDALHQGHYDQPVPT
jgi:hypothetical protein